MNKHYHHWPILQQWRLFNRIVLCLLAAGGHCFSRAAEEVKEPAAMELVSSTRIGNEICGAYVMIGELTANYALHVFPDGDAFIAETSDISPSILVASGKWTLDTGILRLDFTRLHEHDAVAHTRVSRMSRAYNLFQKATADGWTLFHLVADGQRPKVDKAYPVRVASYVNWPQIKSGLLGSKEVEHMK